MLFKLKMSKKRRLVNAASGSIDSEEYDSSDGVDSSDESLDLLKQSESQVKVSDILPVKRARR